jgi:acyl dehydratase
MPEVKGMYFEDFAVDDTWLSARRTVTETDVVNFAGATGDFNPLHVDHEFARGTDFGGPVAHGLLVLSFAAGLSVQSLRYHGTMIAFLGMEEWKFVGPVRFGDTIQLRSTVLEARASSKPGRGVVRIGQEIVNQRDEVVQKGVWASLVATRA